jgi:hypothetical protein
MTIRACLLTGFSLACATFALGTASANISIPVTNPSFETLPVGGLPLPYSYGATYSEAPIPGWTNFQGPGASGQFQPGTPGGVFNYIPDGSIVAYSNGGIISQTVGATVQAGDTYTMSVFIGNRLDCCDAGGASADLLVNGNQYFAAGTVATLGNWTQWTATYVGTPVDAGDSITIQLNSLGGQGDFDAVSLTSSATATPEPGYAALMLFGLGSLILTARSYRAKRPE